MSSKSWRHGRQLAVQQRAVGSGNHQLRRRTGTTSGFTLLETLAVAAILGILMAIAVPAWLTFLNAKTLTAGQDQVYLAMRQAQTEAKRSRTERRISFREQSGQVEWAIHDPDALLTGIQWQPLPRGIGIDAESSLPNSNGVYYMRFDQNGNVRGQLGRLTLKGHTNSRALRCVIVSTLLGVLRKASDNPQPQDGKYCY
ncbi:MAG: type II secretion system protein [Synechococcales bacterium]|nr:type II secretion system protein [Synechococcales bacterium]